MSNIKHIRGSSTSNTTLYTCPSNKIAKLVLAGIRRNYAQRTSNSSSSYWSRLYFNNLEIAAAVSSTNIEHVYEKRGDIFRGNTEEYVASASSLILLPGQGISIATGVNNNNANRVFYNFIIIEEDA